jgi:hypothetical protein
MIVFHEGRKLAVRNDATVLTAISDPQKPLNDIVVVTLDRVGMIDIRKFFYDHEAFTYRPTSKGMRLDLDTARMLGHELWHA